MKAYLALVHVNLKLAMRERIAIFFNYVFPLIFFFTFGQMMHAEQGGVIIQVVTMVLVIGILGNGLFGGGIRAVQDREQNILRRFKVAPISPTPMLVASMVTGWALYIPAVVLTLALAHFVYGMAVPERWLSLLVLATVGIFAFRSIGLIIASVANSAQESQILVQLVYLPMLFLTGTTFPTSILPSWGQTISHFLPATYLVTGLQGILVRNETVAANWSVVAVLLVTMAAATFVSVLLFRWEKEEKLRQSAKLWLTVMVLPTLVLGAWQIRTNDQASKTRALFRDVMRSRTLLLRGARIFIGDGRVIDPGSVLIRGGKIADVYPGSGPPADSLKAEVVEAAGKTVLPGFIDADVHLAMPGGWYQPASDYRPEVALDRELAAYLYSGVTAVRSSGDSPAAALAARLKIAQAQRLGAQLFTCGPQVAAKTAEEAARTVEQLRRSGVDAIEAGPAQLQAIAAAARAHGLPLVVRTGSAEEAGQAVAAGASVVEQGSYRDAIPDAVFAEMARRRIAYVPALSVAEAARDLLAGSTALLDRSLVEQVGPPALLRGTRAALRSPATAALSSRLDASGASLKQAEANLLRAWKAGVVLAAGSGAGNWLVFHGPSVQHELALWVQAGIPAPVALQGATSNAARLLGPDSRFGLVASGRDPDLLVVDGDPLQDIVAAERISIVIFKGERVDRSKLLEQ